MILYAESSAVLSWLLGEPEGSKVAEALDSATFVVSSELTLVECDRALHRAAHLETLPDGSIEDCRSVLQQAASRWILLTLASPIVQRAREPFPEEPLRSLDALHVASALEARTSEPSLALLSLDHRVRRCGRALGMEILPPNA